MGKWLETYRGAVSPWECDVVEHFTIAYYFERLGDANLALLESLGLGNTRRRQERRATATVQCYLRFERELRAGDVLHIDSAVLGAQGKAVRLGHKLFNSASGEVAATAELTAIHFDMEARTSIALPEADLERLDRAVQPWDGPTRQDRPVPADDAPGFMESGLDSAKAWEVDVLGHMSFQYHVHRFSMAAAQAMSAMGMTPDYMRAERRGMSTFEIDLRFVREFQAGDLIAVKTGLVHLGTSSFRLLHRMTNPTSGAPGAVMSQFGVHLDMDARRPAPIPDELRARAQALLVPMDGASG